MPGKVTLRVTEGPIKGEVFAFEHHDTFIFGRDRSCHAKLPDGDTTASRHHFLIEVNPPCARIRDLGSLNGTRVNSVKYGGREAHETPEEAARRIYPEVDIYDGDVIRVGHTTFTVMVEVPAVCGRCGRTLSEEEKLASSFKDDAYTCPQCLMAANTETAQPSPLVSRVCSQCGGEIPSGDRDDMSGEGLCPQCSEKARTDPIAALMVIFSNEARKRGEPEMEEFPGYQVTGLLGKGGMGAVYLAVRRRDGVKVAIKVMLARVAVDETARKMFNREMDVTMRLRHANIVELYEKGSAGNGFYFVMEYVPGGSIEDLIDDRDGRLSLEEAAPIMMQSLQGLAYIHDQGFIHRDLKPRNILLTSRTRGMPKISDLGSAKNFQEAGFSGMTVTGAMTGTPMYMPREQLLNFRYVKPVSDVWSMSATFYEMLTGTCPREIGQGESPLAAVLKKSAVPIRQRDSRVPEAIASVIDRALSDKEQDRFQNAGEFLEALNKVL